RDERRAAGDDEHVVVERRPVLESHPLRVDVDTVDGRLHELDAAMQLPAPRSHDVLDVGETEGHEQQARLVDVTVVLIDDGDRHVRAGEATAQPVGGQGAARTAAEDHHAGGHRADPNAAPTSASNAAGSPATCSPPPSWVMSSVGQKKLAPPTKKWGEPITPRARPHARSSRTRSCSQ